MKKWYASKTVWVNLVAGIAILVQAFTGEAWLDAEAQGGLIVVINLILRIITKQGLEA